VSFAQIDLKLQSWEIGSDHGERLVMKDVCKNYYKQALQIKIDFNDRFSQASTYHQLGIVAQQQRQWEQARQYLLETLKINGKGENLY
jgi:tetratricopeptide (TPR) repeat protein